MRTFLIVMILAALIIAALVYIASNEPVIECDPSTGENCLQYKPRAR